MGRSRGPRASASEDFGQKSKRKKTTSSGENLEVNATGQEKNEGKKALYHCNYCNKDISEKVRIKCVRCPDFDLCVECFSVGAEITPHKSNHPYRVMDNLSFPIICPDWNADEETLLLEGIEMCGMGNWTEVAEHVTTKSKAQCMDHYYSAYMNSPCFPLPDMSQFAGRNREELLAMAKAPGNGKTGFPPLGKLTVKEEPVFSPSSVKIEEATVGRSPSKSSADEESGVGASSSYASATTAAVKKASNKDQAKDDPNVIKVEDSLPDRSIGGKKPISSGTEGPSMAELSGYNSKRQEFDPEYDNDAEQLLADMEFNDTDTQAERELKLRVLHIYNKRLDERKRRKNFILERNLLAQDPWEKDLSHEEREIYNRYKVFMRFLPKEEYDGLTKAVIGQYRARKRIQELQEARAAGCRTSADVDRYHEHKRKKEAEESALRAKVSTQVGPSGKLTQKTSRLKVEPNLISPRGGVRGSTSSEFGGKDYQPSTTAPSASSYLEVWDITGLPGSDLLSECEKRLCEEMRMLPSQYLKMLEVMSKEIFKGSLSKKSDAHGLFRVDSSKVDRVFDMLVSKGIVPPGS